MKLLSVAKARSVWLFAVQELNPQGKNINQPLGEWLKNRYHFASYPEVFTETEATKKSGYVFGNGSFKYGDATTSVALTVHSDGLIGDTISSTDATDAFLQDVLEGVKTDFGLSYDPAMVWQRAHISELNVRCERDLKGLGPKVAQLEECLNAALRRNESAARRDTFRLDGITFRADWQSSNKMPPFTFESRVNMPFAENRYYSQAPLRTGEHLGLLEKLEHILSS
jgi:hypothetical protein